MRVPLEPHANLAAAAGGGADAAPQKHKPLLQARRNQYEDYRNLKDRDFQSLHEEVTFLRQSTRDQERIIALLKEEKSRLLAELLQKSHDLQHYKDLLKKPAHTTEERNALGDMKRTIADRECTIDELKSEIVRLNNIHQRALEDYDDLYSKQAMMDQEVLTAKQFAEHKQSEVERLQQDIVLLNEEMAARMRNINAAVDHAAEVGKRDAATNHNLLEESLEMWKKKYEDCQMHIKRLQDDDQRHKEHALSQQLAANEAAAEKATLLGEVRRQQSLLSEVDDLKAQIETFRLAKATTEEVLREKLHVALVDIHEEKALSRRLMAEVDAKDDVIAAKDRDIAKHVREFTIKVDEAAANNKAMFRAKEEELMALLQTAQKEKVIQSEDAAKLSIRLDNAQKRLKEAEDNLHSSAVECTTLKRQMSALSDELHSTKALLDQHVDSAREAEAQSQQFANNHKLSMKDLFTRDQMNELQAAWETERIELVAQHANGITRVEQEAQTKIAAVAAQAHDRTAALEIEILALREAQGEHDHVRHSTLADEADHLRADVATLTDALQQAVVQLEQERHNKAELEAQLDALASAVESATGMTLHAQQEGSSSSAQAALTALGVKRDEQVAELTSARQELEVQLALRQTQEKERSDAADKRIERLERDKKQLADKLKVAEVARDDKDKSLDIRAQQLRQEAEALRAAQEALEKMKLQLQNERQERNALVADHKLALEAVLTKHTDELQRLRDELAASQQRSKELAEANDRMKNIQMHW